MGSVSFSTIAKRGYRGHAALGSKELLKERRRPGSDRGPARSDPTTRSRPIASPIDRPRLGADEHPGEVVPRTVRTAAAVEIAVERAVGHTSTDRAPRRRAPGTGSSRGSGGETRTCRRSTVAARSARRRDRLAVAACARASHRLVAGPGRLIDDERREAAPLRRGRRCSSRTRGIRREAFVEPSTGSMHRDERATRRRALTLTPRTARRGRPR